MKELPHTLRAIVRDSLYQRVGFWGFCDMGAPISIGGNSDDVITSRLLGVLSGGRGLCS